VIHRHGSVAADRARCVFSRPSVGTEGMLPGSQFVFGGERRRPRTRTVGPWIGRQWAERTALFSTFSQLLQIIVALFLRDRACLLFLAKRASAPGLTTNRLSQSSPRPPMRLPAGDLNPNAPTIRTPTRLELMGRGPSTSRPSELDAGNR